jgi:hypothetical protein
MTTTAQDRAARAKRARADGNKRAPAKASPTTALAPAKRAAERQPAKRSAAAPAKVLPTTSGKGHQLDLAEVVDKMDLSQVQCRDFGHSWRPYSARWLAQYNSYESQLQCMRCKTIRTRFLSRTGEQLSSAYDYADGYLVKGMGRLSGHDRDVIRLASILAVITVDTADE